MAQITLNSTGVASSGSLLLQTNGTTTQATLDTSGNLGLGVTPSAWGSGNTAFQLGNGGIWKSGSRSVDWITNGYYNGTNYIYNQTAAATYYRQYDGSHQWYNAASGTAGNAITFTQAMTLDASGNLGLGTTSPTSYGSTYSVFEVAGSVSGVINVKSGSTLYGQISNGTNLFKLDAVGASSSLLFLTNTTERARIDSSGNLLVGQTTQNGNVVGFSVSPTGVVRTAASASTNSTTTWETYSTGASAYRFYVGFGGTVYATSTTISAISDIRFKENVRDLDAGLAEVMALKPRLYDWKEGKGADIKNARGFIAQEFEQVFPDLIDEWKDEAPEGEEPYKSVRADLIPVLVKAIQEQQAIITALTARIEALEQA